MSGLDSELVDIFVEEGGDLLDKSAGLLAQLREAPESREAIVGLQRELHTLKGGARMAGIMPVGELGHAMETLLEAVVAQRAELGRDGVPLLERGFDRLHGMITRVAARRAVGMPVGLIDEFNVRAEAPLAVVEAVDDGLRFAAKPVEKIELKPLSAPMVAEGLGAVSYTHLDVYKRQVLLSAVASTLRMVEVAAPAIEEPVIESAPAVETVAVQVDPVLLDILGAEVVGHLETVDAWLDQARGGDGSVNDGLLRAIHTLNGAFAMTEVPSVTAFTSPAEGYVKRLLAAGQPADAEGIFAIGEVADAVRASTLARQATPAKVPLLSLIHI